MLCFLEWMEIITAMVTLAAMSTMIKRDTPTATASSGRIGGWPAPLILVTVLLLGTVGEIEVEIVVVILVVARCDDDGMDIVGSSMNANQYAH